MNNPDTVHRPGKALMMHTMFALLLTHLGAAGVVYMILVEDDPPALPLLMIAAGGAWFIIAQRKLRRR